MFNLNDMKIYINFYTVYNTVTKAKFAYIFITYFLFTKFE